MGLLYYSRSIGVFSSHRSSVSKKSIVNLFRESCRERHHLTKKLEGRGKVVEIDKSKFFKSKYERGRNAFKDFKNAFTSE